jgi:prepilin-type N-terminal cleavage/methylation domain-containing protein
MTPSKKSGFTLIELLVVIAIIGVLASIILASLKQARAKARDSKRIQDITQINTAIQLYMNDHNGEAPKLENDACLIVDHAIRDVTCTADNRSTAGKANWEHLQNELAPYISLLSEDPLALHTENSSFVAYAQIDPGENCDAGPNDCVSPYSYIYRAPSAASAIIWDQNPNAQLSKSSYQIYVEKFETKDGRFGFGLDL